MKLWRHNRESWRFWCHDDDGSRFGKLPEEAVEADKGTEGQEESKFLHKHLPFLHPVKACVTWMEPCWFSTS